MSEARVYGVSYGNGNDGVSQLFPDFYVTTAEPYTLAFAAMIDQFSSDYMSRYAKRTEVDGEADYTIQALIYDPIGSAGWSEHNGCWKICEVFPVAPDDVRSGRPTYDTLEAAISAPAMRRAKRWAKRNA